MRSFVVPRARARVLAPGLTLGVVLALAAGACASSSSARKSDAARPVGNCIDACNARASKHCSERECTRGCMFILDRLAEKEEKPILACVAAAPGACDDALWALCAARVGPHADGGPPAPPPPEE